MSTDTLKSQLEALLFVSDESVTVAELSAIVEKDPDAVTKCLESLHHEYLADNRGFQLRALADGWRLSSNPTHHDLLEKYILSWDTRRLSQAALEALAVIAYRQPVSRNTINAIRGVNSEAVIGSLLDKDLIKEIGREKAPGNAILFGTTKTFLEKFGLASLDELESIEQFEPHDDTISSIRQRLDATLPLSEAEHVKDNPKESDAIDATE